MTVGSPTPIGVGGLRGADSLVLPFSQGILDSRITFTGGANRTYFDSTPTMQDASTDVARFDHLLSDGTSLGLSVWEARTNGIRNNTMTNAAAGTPGTAPDNWTIAANGTTLEIVAVGTTNGINTIDVKWSGTPTSDPFISFDTSTAIDALTTETWTKSLYLALIDGDLTNITGIHLRQIERTEAGASVKNNVGADIKGSLTSTLQRFEYTVALSGGGTVAHILPNFFVNWDASGDIDLTLRIGLPKEAEGTAAGPVVKTTNAAVTATADVVTIASPPATVTVLLQGRTSPGLAEQVLWQQDDGTENNRKRIVRDASGDMRLFVTTGGVERITSGMDMGAVANATDFALAVQIVEANYASSLNGATVVTDTSAGSLPTITTGRLGSDNNGNYWNATLARSEEWLRTIGNGELQAQTA